MSEKYTELERCDFKCLEQCIRDINANRNRVPEKKEVKYKCKRDEDAICAMYKMLEDIEKNQKHFDKYNYEKWLKWKKDGKIHLDDSNKLNPYIRSIYYNLWGKRIDLVESQGKNIGIYENGWGSFSKSYLFDNEKMLWGGDTMNTIASYKSNMENFGRESIQNKGELDEFCRVVHQLGNFVLVPACFNQFRGRKIRDYMDKSLEYLKENDFELLGNMQLKDSKKSSMNKKEKEEFIKIHFADWGKKNFSKYINTFFLWDYVTADNSEYYIRNLKSDHMDEITSVNESRYKITKENVGIYIKNAKAAISRRSIFMTAMLMLAVEFREEKIDGYQDRWPDWKVSNIYKKIVKEVFLANKVYKDISSVIEKIKEILQGGQYEAVLDILNQKELA